MLAWKFDFSSVCFKVLPSPLQWWVLFIQLFRVLQDHGQRHGTCFMSCQKPALWAIWKIIFTHVLVKASTLLLLSSALHLFMQRWSFRLTESESRPLLWQPVAGLSSSRLFAPVGRNFLLKHAKKLPFVMSPSSTWIRVQGCLVGLTDLASKHHLQQKRGVEITLK